MKTDIRKEEDFELYILVFNNKEHTPINKIDINYINDNYIYTKNQFNILKENLIYEGYYI
tara:strand:+ start:1244 stop:1423 length:180 start_codon:yes stop_codon:yes gene_type:complete